MRLTFFTYMICLGTIVSSFAACSRDDDGAMAAYKEATLQAGTGLGDIALGTTLADFVTKFGEGRVTYIASDEQALELNFLGGNLSFLFPIEGDCWKDIGMSGGWRGQGVTKWTEATPSCKKIILSSISVADSGDFDGQTNQGVKLGDAITRAYAHGQMLEVGAQRQLMAGLSSDNPENHIEYKDGISFYYTADDPNNLETTSIRRMTIFKVK